MSEKRYVEELSEVFVGLFRDATKAYPTLEVEFERDLARLRFAIEQRGLHVLVVDLPAIAKHLDRCLALSQFTLSGLPLTKRFSGRVVIPKFLRGLYLLVFNRNGTLRDDYDVQAIFFLRQILSVGKKAELPCSPDRVLAEVQEFISVDSELPEPEKFWDLDHVDAALIAETYKGFDKSDLYRERIGESNSVKAVRMSIFLDKMCRVARLICSALGPYRPEQWNFRHGPGAISQVTGPTNKFTWFTWSDRLESVFPIADYGYHNQMAWASDVVKQESGEEPYSRLVDVPKTFIRPRLIAAEPSEHQWCQQNIWQYFCTRVDNSWINDFILFQDQSRNQELCVRGSKDGSLATVDLSSASDRVTCHAVGQLFKDRPDLLRALHATRTRLVKQSYEHNAPELLRLRKFSTMGSACTFPVESLMFLCAALAASLAKRKLKVTMLSIESLMGEVAVFGDDLIVPVDCRSLLEEGLEVLHFKINKDKTFWTGKFRESCGVDAFDGHNVTPVYWHAPTEDKPESILSKVEVCNNFYKRFLLTTAAVLRSTIPRVLPLVPVDSGVCGLKSFCSKVISGVKTRYNKWLQRNEWLVPVPTVEVRSTPITDDSALLQYFTEAPSPFQKWKGGVRQRPLTRFRYGWVAEY